ncbi:MAG: two-component system, NarL family, sensor histidine kinase UhpB [Solirubrobacteraceae bacterium]|jgi:two-component system sensor histidine kinase UhpB|nr:two-component system, NarL family, sensor histidine kinase UhpB [Solirubrobacteraceae bacterium]
MRSRTLLTQVLAVNAVLVALTAALAAIFTRERLQDAASVPGISLLVVSVLLVILLNSLLLRHRLTPLNQLVTTMKEIDLANPGRRAGVDRHAAKEIKALNDAFNHMLERLEEERKAAGRAVVRGQEQERAQIAQDLHDEVNQALTAIKLRMLATMHDAPPGLALELRETKLLVDRAMDELLAIARALRPTALDDHGLISALRSQVTDFGERTGIRTTFHRHGELTNLSDEEQLVIYRVTQESLSNIAHHAGARTVDVDLSFTGNTVLKVADDGGGFDALGANRNGKLRARPGGLGLNGMRERALLVGGSLSIFSRPGEGTTIELTMGTK